MEQQYRLYSSMAKKESEKNRAAVDLAALKYNFCLLRDTVRAKAPRCRMISVIKADAYGHGAPACARALLDAGCDFFAVASLDEALTVRAACADSPADILIFGYTDPRHAATLAEKGLTQTLLDEAYATALHSAAAQKNVTVRVHIALDTGMNRIGFPAQTETDIADTAERLARICSLPRFCTEGMFTHFARADEEPQGEGDAQTALQTARFYATVDALKARGIEIPFLHVCNSAGALQTPDAYADGVRLGIALYGISPTPHISLPLRPVMRLQTTVVHCHELAKGQSVGYGGAFCADRTRRIATLPIGYADGFLRAHSGATVTVHTKSGEVRVPVVGRVCMDQCMLDVTDTDAAVGDAVTLFGAAPEELDSLAAHAGTIPYELLCLITARVPRVYL